MAFPATSRNVVCPTATGVVEFDIWTVSGDFALKSFGDADAAVDYGTVVVQAGHKLRELQQHGAR